MAGGTVKQKIVIEADTSKVVRGADDAARSLQGTANALKATGQANLDLDKAVQKSSASLKGSAEASKEAKRQISLYTSAVKTHGAESDAAKAAMDAMSAAVAKAKEEYNAARVSLNQAERALQKFREEGKEATAEARAMERAISRARNAVARQEVEVKKLAARQTELASSSAKAKTSQGGFLQTLGKSKGAVLAYTAALAAGAAALGQVIEKTTEYSERATKIEAVQRAQKLTIEEARSSTRGLISDYELASLANQALQLKVSDSADAFAEAAEAAVKLGFSVGADGGAAKQVEDLIGALGRGSTEVLDNLGINLKVSDAQREYAKRLGVTTSALTDQQKAEAFRVIGLEKVIAAAERTGVALDGQGTALQRTQTRWDNFMNQTVIPAVAEATDKTVTWIEESAEVKTLADALEHRVAFAWKLVEKTTTAVWTVVEPVYKSMVRLSGEIDLALESFMGVLEDGRAAVVDFIGSFDLLPDAADGWIEEWGLMLVPVVNLVVGLEKALTLVNQLTGARSNQIKRLVLEEGKKRYDEAEERERIQKSGSLAEESYSQGTGEQYGSSLELFRTKPLPQAPKKKDEKKKKGKRQATPEVNTAFEEQLDAELAKLAERTAAMQEQATLNREIAEEERDIAIAASRQRLEVLELEKQLAGERSDINLQIAEEEQRLFELERERAAERGELAEFELEQKKVNFERAIRLQEQAAAREAEIEKKRAERQKELETIATGVSASLGQVSVAALEAAATEEQAVATVVAAWAKGEAIRMALVAAKEAALAIAAAASYNYPGAAAHAAAAGKATAVAVAMGAVAGGVGAAAPGETAAPGVGGAGGEEGQFQIGAAARAEPTIQRGGGTTAASKGPVETEVPISHQSARAGRALEVHVGQVTILGNAGPAEKADIGRMLYSAIKEAERADGELER